MDHETPAGWIRLARGTVILEGDRWWDRERQEWSPARCVGSRVGVANAPVNYIRRVK